MLSSETTDAQVDEAMRVGADGFIFKPVTIDELEQALEARRFEAQHDLTEGDHSFAHDFTPGS